MLFILLAGLTRHFSSVKIGGRWRRSPLFRTAAAIPLAAGSTTARRPIDDQQ